MNNLGFDITKNQYYTNDVKPYDQALGQFQQNIAQSQPLSQDQQAQLNYQNNLAQAQQAQMQPIVPQSQSQSDAFQTNQINKNELVGANQQPQASIMPSQASMFMPQGSGYGQAMQGLKTEMLAGQKEAQLKSAYYNDLNKYNQQVDDEYRQKLADQQAKIQDATTKFENTQKEIQDNVRVNPNRYMQNLSTGQSIMAGIAVALGGLGAALQGTNKNLAFDSIERAIDRDINAQESEIRNKKDSLQAQGTLLNMYEKQLGNTEAAKALAKRDLYHVAELKMNEQFNGLNGVAQQKMMGEYQKNIGMLQMKQQEQQQTAMKSYLENATANKAISGQGLSGQDVLRLPEDMRKNVVKVGDQYLVATGTTEKSNLAEKLPAMVSFQDKGRQVMTLMDKPGTKSYSLEDKAKINTLMSDMATSYSKLKGLGSYDNGTADLIKQVQGDPTSFFSLSSSDKAKIKQAIQAVETDKQSLLKTGTFGYQGVK